MFLYTDGGGKGCGAVHTWGGVCSPLQRVLGLDQKLQSTEVVATGYDKRNSGSEPAHIRCFLEDVE